MDTNHVIEAVRTGSIPKVDDNPHYAIYDCVVKQYPAATFLVQSSGEPINLGQMMLPLMETGALHEYVQQHNLPLLENSPVEVYLYNWVQRAQGPMVFDVGVTVVNELNDEDIGDTDKYVIKRYPPLKCASIIYHGPFPFQPMSGWGNIHWEQRARDKGLVYTERLYRELYHQYDFDSNWHITEIQMEIE